MPAQLSETTRSKRFPNAIVVPGILEAYTEQRAYAPHLVLQDLYRTYKNLTCAIQREEFLHPELGQVLHPSILDQLLLTAARQKLPYAMQQHIPRRRMTLNEFAEEI
eukprot:Protomagalhaensia_wolfi_Nauph_80__2438@NODE_2613_length_1039_cov_15_279000_g2046_i0_p3_GENE_NODE_2613_length_1039_cov_15_279000_g2046_i0NODE_2613_length_1039_cov_15_279000_g2046_i0_p3_ORF_typecomplete_len107_score13_48RTT107_BRCT_5/PF16770_5/0_11_NODE_2613_length_1039_cov_15_279000_g2046_i0383703